MKERTSVRKLADPAPTCTLLYYILSLTKFFLDSFWNSVENRRSFFDDYAKANKFDPHDRDSWYEQPKEKIFVEKVYDFKRYIEEKYTLKYY